MGAVTRRDQTGSCFSSGCPDLGAHRDTSIVIDARSWLASMSLHDPHVTSYCQAVRLLHTRHKHYKQYGACNCTNWRRFDRTTLG
jgi:hypothetical protein